MTVPHQHKWRSTGHPGEQITQRCEECGVMRLVDRPSSRKVDRGQILSELQDRLYVARLHLEAVESAPDLETAKQEARRALERIGPVMCPPNRSAA